MAKNMKAMGDLMNSLAFDYDGDFNWLEKRILAYKALTYEDFLVTAKSFLGRENKKRLAILLRGEIPEEKSFSYTKARTWNMIRKMSLFFFSTQPNQPVPSTSPFPEGRACA